MGVCKNRGGPLNKETAAGYTERQKEAGGTVSPQS